ncbi:MAG: ABC transporter permease subunit [Nitrospinaceae bacterium]|jgi:ABC-2 type transport system permease protein|nr:ABC transporter permease subunit [Nitrospinaceae bacterium]MBT3435657.1 ABC transporter permease subunit [Nitrospinaceae bacterium]MBT3820804.1 ABC transporter permease subunit [Nitrospinaceae bacterium]MBT4095783.1 ABC transporter permease subunit [Nitrospinaceae bacterium]MBT4430484.1 ABC transporter permease subunit [Nitrospinaceae bacterium]
MYNIWLICRRELSSFFFSPIAYVILAAWTLLLGVFYSGSFLNYAVISLQIMRNPQAAARLNLTPTSAILGPVFSSTTVILLFVIPLLTMRLFSEEKKQGTMELILTYPLRDIEVLLGKYLSAILLYVIMLALTFIYPAILAAFVAVDWSVVGASYLGLFLMGSAFMAVGVFASSLTSNQIVAAMIAFMVLLASFVLDFLSVSSGPFISGLLRHLSLGLHLRSFIQGVIDTRDIVFLVNVNVLCLFLAMRSLEYYKWRG